MRAREFLLEGETSTIESDIEDLLVAAKANDLEELDTEDIVAQLNDMGHSVTADSLLNLLNDREDDYIKNATLNTIVLKSHTVDDEGENGEFEETDEERTEDLAQKTALKRIKDRAKRHKKAAKDVQL